MTRHTTISFFMLAASLLACGDDGSAGDGTTGSPTTSGDGGDDNLTLPVTTATPGDDGVDDSDTASSSGSEGSTGMPDPDGTGSSTTGGSDSSGSGSGEESSTGEPAAVTIDWCRLQESASDTVMVSQAYTVYGRVYVENVTDQSPDNDPYPTLVAEVGFGEVGSDPAAGGWTWVQASPNPGWDSQMFGEPNNDEYWGDLVIDTAGMWNYAIRFSGDSGNRWVYCDLDDLLTGGYTPDQAGTVTVTE